VNRFFSAFELVTSALGRAEVEYVVVGSVAATFWGLLRTTIDIDIILMVPQSGGDELITDLRTRLVRTLCVIRWWGRGKLR